MEWRIAALKLFGPFVRWHVRRRIVRVWRAFLAEAGVTEEEVEKMRGILSSKGWRTEATAVFGVFSLIGSWLLGDAETAAVLGKVADVALMLVPIFIGQRVTAARKAAATPTP